MINKAGRQRMLCERIAKDHLLLVEDYGNGDVRQELTFACVGAGAEDILQRMERVTSLYERLAACD